MGNESSTKPDRSDPAMRHRVGILGGTFDPIHQGHLILAREALTAFRLEQVILMPSGHSYFKDTREQQVTPARQRLEMTRLAAMGEPGMSVSDLEVNREGNTYTCETLKELCKAHPDTDYFFIVGADTICAMRKWYHPEEIFSRCTILTAVREDQVDGDLLQEEIRSLRKDFGAQIEMLPVLNIGISSTDIRSRVSENRNLKYLIPAAVEAYIRENALYSAVKNEKVDQPGQSNNLYLTHSENRLQILRMLEQSLPYRRFLHTIGVADLCCALAARYGADQLKADTAGLLHDCAKHLPHEDMARICIENGVEISEAERKNPELLHAKCGVILARDLYGITDDEILSAIRYHSTGRPAMTMLEKILYISDYIEPNRYKIRDLEEVRRLAFEDLDSALLRILSDTLSYLNQGKKILDNMTVKTYDYYKGGNNNL